MFVCERPLLCCAYIFQYNADMTNYLHSMYVQSLHRVLLFPECCVIKLGSIMETTHLPLWIMGGLLHGIGLGGPERGLIFILMIYMMFIFVCLFDFFF